MMVYLYNFPKALVQSRKNLQGGISMRCENCGNESPEGSKFCIKCGKEFKTSEPAKCPHCGAEIAPGTLFCPSCGKSIAAPGIGGELGGGGAKYEPLPPYRRPAIHNVHVKHCTRHSPYADHMRDILFLLAGKTIKAVNYLLEQERYNFWVMVCPYSHHLRPLQHLL